MTLFAYNVTGSTVTLAAGRPTPVLPPSTNPPDRGPGVDVTSELKGLSDAEYALLEAQRQSPAKFSPHIIEYEWSGDAEFSLGTLTSDAISIHVPSFHASTHGTGGGDPLTVASTTATSQNETPTNQPATATDQNATATNQNETTGIGVDNSTATNQGAAATNNALALAGSTRFVNPKLSDITSVVATIDMANGGQTILVQPDYPRSLRFRRIDVDTSVTAGTLDLVGIGADGSAVSESIPLSGGTATLEGDEAYARLISATISGLNGAVAGDTISIGLGTRLGLPIPVGATNVAVNKTVVNSVDEPVGGGVIASTRTVIPSSPPDGARDYDFFYSYEVLPTQASHTHVQDAHNHAVTDAGHTHVQDTHLHVQDAHTHTQNTHTHTQNAHTHNTSG